MRKLVVIGNCQAEMVATGLRHPAFAGHLDARYHFVELPAKFHEAGREDLAACDAVLIQDISNFGDYPLRASISERVEMISFPCLRLASPWPFDSQNGPGDSHAQACEVELPVFAHFDGLLARLRGEVPDGEARFRAYRSLAVGGLVNFQRMHQFEERRLLALDRRFSCSMGRFVLNNFRSARLFCATGKPKPALYRLLLAWLLSRLGVAGGYPEDGSLAAAEIDEVPVHPIVAGALGMTWADEAAVYRFHGESIRWEQYVKQYIARFG